MSGSQRFDRNFADLLAELAEPQFPDYFDDVLTQAIGHRQRPAWTFPERWIPMGVLTRRLTLFPALPGRTVGILMLLLLLLLATVVIGVGALLLQQQRPAPPFGIAANGLIAYSYEGDIYTRDLATGESRLIVGGPAFDVGPWFSRDGSQIIFARVLETEPQEVVTMMSVDAAGAAERTLVAPEAAGEVHWSDISPEGRLFAVVNSAEGTPGLSVVELASGTRTPVDLAINPTEFEWTVDSRGFIIRGEDAQGAAALYYVNVDGTDLRQLTETARGNGQFMSPFPISHDGRYLAYSSFRGNALYLHMLDLETDEVTIWLPPIGVGMATGWPAFSPDNEKIAYVNYSQPSSTEISAQVMVGPIEGGTAAAQPVGPLVRIPQMTRGLAVQFSPDGESLLITSDAGEAWLASVASLAYDEISFARDEFPPAWQRRAP
jgi:Tol biopolymer transport system component